mgnify:CR=1 FL=1
MAKELSEDSKFQISVKTLIAIVMAVVTVVSAYFGLMSTINSKFSELEGQVHIQLIWAILQLLILGLQLEWSLT